MRISELAAASGTSIATIKFYLREQLLPPGRATSTTRSEYDGQHLEALRLVKALHTAGLSLADIRRVVTLLQEPIEGPAGLLAVAATIQEMTALREGEPPEVRDDTLELVHGYGWYPEGNPAAVTELQNALDAVAAAGFEVTPAIRDAYAQGITEMARVEVAGLPSGSLAEMLRYSVLGALLMERVLLAMRRLAESSIAVELLGGPEAVAQLREQEAAGGSQASETSSA